MANGTPSLPVTAKWRRSAENLTGDQLDRLREAFRRAMAIKDDRGYWGHAGIHGLTLPDHCRIANAPICSCPGTAHTSTASSAHCRIAAIPA